MGAAAGANGDVDRAKLTFDVVVLGSLATISVRVDDPACDVPADVRTFHVSREAPIERFMECVRAGVESAILRGAPASAPMLDVWSAKSLLGLIAAELRRNVDVGMEEGRRDEAAAADRSQGQVGPDPGQRPVVVVADADAGRSCA